MIIDRLGNGEIRIILSARNYHTLKDTIRATQDEELPYNRPQCTIWHMLSTKVILIIIKEITADFIMDALIVRTRITYVSFNRPPQNYFQNQSGNYRKTNMQHESTRLNRGWPRRA